MAYGLEIYDENGKLVASADQQSFVLRKTGTVTTLEYDFNSSYNLPSYFDIDITTTPYEHPIIAFASEYAVGFIGDQSTWRRFGSDAPIGTDIDYYIFDSSGTIEPATFGLEIYDEDGNITFSTNHRMMRTLDVMSYTPPDVPYGGGIIIGGTGTEFTGKTIAVAPTAWAGFERYDDLAAMCYDTEPPENWGESGGGCANLKMPVRARLLGARIIGGNQADLEYINFQQYQITTSSTGAGNLVSRARGINLLVLDVTGIPIGVTYF